MGFSGAEASLEVEGQHWVVAGIATRVPLGQISTMPAVRESDGENESAGYRTPTAKEARISEKLTCPPAPRKRGKAPAPRCRRSEVKEFFPAPDDLESLFLRKFS